MPFGVRMYIAYDSGCISLDASPHWEIDLQGLFIRAAYLPMWRRVADFGTLTLLPASMKGPRG